ncbi:MULTISPECIES: DUF2958 domain-containing protein [Halanaerobium]|jgi:hypothetical protein|uniref:DUF2958 family protein n=2 Tax=Halanaerobium TaxID=2330 RepID=A0A1G6QI36_9FIRM|nr:MULTISPECIES: DUF2958 domain-containing protein [Halanaerobium]PUU86127.1 MAG: hypothetical protein CI948_2939 [Halanaerobium sp.]TDP89650.1 hypothetical protein C7957_12311 [Halanaerobium saccharolyticum]SDC91811.1 Protein of unknown function [Halanaerobium congolense]
MKLLTKEIEKKLPAIEEAKNSENCIVQVKYFHPLSSWTWYVAGYTDDHFWGLVDGDFLETGLISLEELKSVKLLGLGVERDLHFEPKPMSEVRKEIQKTRR